MTRSKRDPQREDAQLARAIRDRSTRGASTSPRKMSLRQSSGRQERHRSNGSHLIDNRLRVYRQGGLDTYCAFYAILNLVNFLKLKRAASPDIEASPDFIGANEFEAFIRFIDAGNFRGFFPERPFGDAGLEAPMLVEALSRTLVHFNLSGKLTIEDDQSLDPYDTDNHESYFRPGTEKIFEATPADVLGLGVVKEDDEDELDTGSFLLARTISWEPQSSASEAGTESCSTPIGDMSAGVLTIRARNVLASRYGAQQNR